VEIGWMWFDDDAQRTLEEKLRLAIQHYHEKFGHVPNTCYVNLALLPMGRERLRFVHGRGQLEVRAARNVMPHYFWLGVEKEQKEAA
jgi:hypothetical protein